LGRLELKGIHHCPTPISPTRPLPLLISRRWKNERERARGEREEGEHKEHERVEEGKERRG